MPKCTACTKDMARAKSCWANVPVHFPDGEVRDAVPHRGETRCGGCGVLPGGYHHPGCGP